MNFKRFFVLFSTLLVGVFSFGTLQSMAAAVKVEERESNKRITFVTGNSDKFDDVARYLKELDPEITLEQVNRDLPEYQSLDVQKIALAKAEEAWRVLQKPLLIDDGGIYLERFNNFPGPLIKYVMQGIGLEGFWLLAKDDPRVYFLTCLVYYYGQGQYQIFEGTCYGTIIQPSGAAPSRKLMPFSDIFVPNGSTKTLTQLRGTPEEAMYHHRRKALAALVEWLKAR